MKYSKSSEDQVIPSFKVDYDFFFVAVLQSAKYLTASNQLQKVYDICLSIVVFLIVS